MNKLTYAEVESISKNRNLKTPPDLIEAFTDISIEEATKRLLVQADWHRAYAQCLDGIEEIKHIRGGGLDSCRGPDDIRRIVQCLVEQLDDLKREGSKFEE